MWKIKKKFFLLFGLFGVIMWLFGVNRTFYQHFCNQMGLNFFFFYFFLLFWLFFWLFRVEVTFLELRWSTNTCNNTLPSTQQHSPTLPNTPQHSTTLHNTPPHLHNHESRGGGILSSLLIWNHFVTKCSFHHNLTEATKQKTYLTKLLRNMHLWWQCCVDQ